MSNIAVAITLREFLFHDIDLPRFADKLSLTEPGRIEMIKGKGSRSHVYVIINDSNMDESEFHGVIISTIRDMFNDKDSKDILKELNITKKQAENIISSSDVFLFLNVEESLKRSKDYPGKKVYYIEKIKN